MKYEEFIVEITILIILAVVVITALAFDFTNGFHDTANAMATSIATGALKPFQAVAISAALNLVGAFLSVHVAKTVAEGIVHIDTHAIATPSDGINLLMVVFSGLIGAIVWNLFTWLLGLPSSSSHALFGGMIGSAFAAMGAAGVEWSNILGKIVIPAVLSPVIAAGVSATATFLVYWITSTIPANRKETHFRHGQTITACLVSLAHGAGDAQKTMGVIFLALLAAGEVNQADSIPLWVVVACAVAIAAGTLSGGWRVIRTLGKGLVDIEAPQGMAAEATSAAIILTSAAGGMPLSTTHVSTGSILGTGLGKKGSTIRWGVAMRMVAAWLITLPCSGIVGFAMYWLGKGVGGAHPLAGMGANLLILLAVVGVILLRAKKNAVSRHNVNEEWDPNSETIDSSINGIATTDVEEKLKKDLEEILKAGIDTAAVCAAHTFQTTRAQRIRELRERRQNLHAQLREIEQELVNELFAGEEDIASTSTSSEHHHPQAPSSPSTHQA